MRLAVSHPEERHGVPETVTGQPLRLKDGILIGDRQRRIIHTDQGSFGGRLVLDLAEGVQAAGRIALKKLDPTLKALLPGQGSRLDVGYATELIKMLVFHRSPPL
jgi:hypothetical protein